MSSTDRAPSSPTSTTPTPSSPTVTSEGELPHTLGLRHALLGVGVVALTLMAGLFVAQAFTSADGDLSQTYLATPIQLAAMALVGATALRLVRGRSWSPLDLGLRLPTSVRGWALAAAVGLGFAAISTIAIQLWPALKEATEQAGAHTTFGETTARDLAFVLSLTVLAPLGEEILYRGLIFRGVHDGMARRGLRRWAMPVAALVSAGLFAVSHTGEGQQVQMPLILLFGLAVSYVYWRTGSLYAAVLAHSISNTITAFYLAAGDGGFVSPVMWAVAAVGPLLALGLLRLLQAALGRGRG